VGGAPPLRSFAGRHRSPLCPTFQHPAPPFRPIDVNSRPSRVAFRIPERIPAGGTAARHGPGRARGARHVAASREPRRAWRRGAGSLLLEGGSTGGPGRSVAPSARALTSDGRGERRCGGRSSGVSYGVTTIRVQHGPRGSWGGARAHPGLGLGGRFAVARSGPGLGEEGGLPGRSGRSGPCPSRRVRPSLAISNEGSNGWRVRPGRSRAFDLPLPLATKGRTREDPVPAGWGGAPERSRARPPDPGAPPAEPRPAPGRAPERSGAPARAERPPAEPGAARTAP
jgi:hypothetical protein